MLPSLSTVILLITLLARPCKVIALDTATRWIDCQMPPIDSGGVPSSQAEKGEVIQGVETPVALETPLREPQGEGSRGSFPFLDLFHEQRGDVCSDTPTVSDFDPKNDQWKNGK